MSRAGMLEECGCQAWRGGLALDDWDHGPATDPRAVLGWRLRKSSVATSRRRHRCRRAAGQRQRALAAGPGLQGAPTSTAARSCRASQHPVSFLRTVVWRHPDRVLGASGRPPVRAQCILRHPVCCVIGSGPLAGPLEHAPFVRAQPWGTRRRLKNRLWQRISLCRKCRMTILRSRCSYRGQPAAASRRRRQP